MKRIIMGMIIGFALCFSTQVFAEGISTEIKAIFAKMNFYVNGQEQVLDADPINYHGSTYLPLRMVGNMLGYDVTYKADSRTIELNISGTAEVNEDNPIEANKGEDDIVIDSLLIESQLSKNRELLKYAEDKLIRDESKMTGSRAFYEENPPTRDAAEYESTSVYQRYIELINADKAEVDRIKAEIVELEAQLSAVYQ